MNNNTRNETDDTVVLYGEGIYFSLDKELAKFDMKPHTCPVCGAIFGVPIDSNPIRYDEEVGGMISLICDRCAKRVKNNGYGQGER